jgi:pimeloyl-ACP methyl ester carboxylesterase
MKKVYLAFLLWPLAFVLNAQPGSLRKLDINLENYQYPYPVHYIRLNIQQQPLLLAYMDVLPVNPNGKLVLLLHGKNFNGAYWEQTAKVLSSNGYRVIIPDQVGFGKSSKPKHLQYTSQLLAQNTRAILDTLKISKAAVLGHSMGGMVATRFALMFPERTEKLILSNPIGLEDWKTKVPYAPVDKQYAKELKQDYDSMKKYQVSNYYHDTWKPEYNKWLNLLAGWTLNEDYPVIAWNAALTSDMIFTQPVCYEFKNIQSPTLLIIGQADRTAIGKEAAPAGVKETLGNYPALGRLTQRKIKNSVLVELPGVGHLPHIESFDAFIRPVLAFLDK